MKSDHNVSYSCTGNNSEGYAMDAVSLNVIGKFVFIITQPRYLKCGKSFQKLLHLHIKFHMMRSTPRWSCGTKVSCFFKPKITFLPCKRTRINIVKAFAVHRTARVPWESLITILLYAFSDDRGKSYSHVSVDDDSRKNKHRRQRQQKRRRQDGGQRGQHDGEDSPTSGTSETFWSNGFNAAASIPSGSYITTTAILFLMHSLSISFAHDV